MPPNNRERQPQNLTWKPPEGEAPFPGQPLDADSGAEKPTEFLRLSKVRLGPDGQGVDIARYYDQQRLLKEQAAQETQAVSSTPPEAPPAAPLDVSPPPARQGRSVKKFEPTRTRPADVVRHDSPKWSREQEIKALERKEQDDRRLAVVVIEDMNAFLQTAVNQPRMLEDVLVRAASQFARHSEYARLLSTAPEAAKLYSDMQIALNGIYERNNGVLQDPNFMAVDAFLQNGKAMLAPPAPEPPVLPSMPEPMLTTDEPHTMAFRRNLVQEEQSPVTNVPINQPPAGGIWARLRKRFGV